MASTHKIASSASLLGQQILAELSEQRAALSGVILKQYMPSTLLRQASGSLITAVTSMTADLRERADGKPPYLTAKGAAFNMVRVVKEIDMYLQAGARDAYEENALRAVKANLKSILQKIGNYLRMVNANKSIPKKALPADYQLVNGRAKYNPSVVTAWHNELAKLKLSELRRRQSIVQAQMSRLHNQSSEDDKRNPNSQNAIAMNNLSLMEKALMYAIDTVAFGKSAKAVRSRKALDPQDVESFAEAALPVLRRITAYADSLESQYLSKVRGLQDNRINTLSQYYAKLGAYLRQAAFHLDRARFEAQQGKVNGNELVSAEGSIANAWGDAILLAKDRETALPQFSQWDATLHTMFNKMRMLRSSKSAKFVKALDNTNRRRMVSYLMTRIGQIENVLSRHAYWNTGEGRTQLDPRQHDIFHSTIEADQAIRYLVDAKSKLMSVAGDTDLLKVFLAIGDALKYVGTADQLIGKFRAKLREGGAVPRQMAHLDGAQQQLSQLIRAMQTARSALNRTPKEYWKSAKSVKAQQNHKQWRVASHTIQTWYDPEHVDPIDSKYHDDPPKMPYVLKIDNGMTQQWKTDGERTAYLNFMMKLPRFHQKSVSRKGRSIKDAFSLVNGIQSTLSNFMSRVNEEYTQSNGNPRLSLFLGNAYRNLMQAKNVMFFAVNRELRQRNWRELDFAVRDALDNIANALGHLQKAKPYLPTASQLIRELLSIDARMVSLSEAAEGMARQTGKSVGRKAVDFKVGDLVAVPTGVAAPYGQPGYGGFNAKVIGVSGSRLRVQTEVWVTGKVQKYTVPANRVRKISGPARLG